jgi:hypothetical protein
MLLVVTVSLCTVQAEPAPCVKHFTCLILLWFWEVSSVVTLILQKRGLGQREHV